MIGYLFQKILIDIALKNEAVEKKPTLYFENSDGYRVSNFVHFLSSDTLIKIINKLLYITNGI
jgi:hypothetical protein